MISIPKKLVVSEDGSPIEVIISWHDYQDLAERMGWDLGEEDLEDLHVAKHDWQSGNRDAFVSLSEVS